MFANALDPTVFTFFIQPRSGVDPAATEKALYDELSRLQTQEGPGRRAAQGEKPDSRRTSTAN